MSARSASEDRIAIFAAIAAGVFAVAQTFRCWLDPLIDSGRDLYLADRLHHGLTLYRDIYYCFPPLAPWVLAALTAITGTSLDAFMAIGGVVALLTACAMWLLVRPIAGPRAAAAALAVFFAFSLTGVRGFGNNYLLPYSQAATMGMLLFLWAGFAVARERYTIASLLLLAASWMKVEFALFAGLLLLLMAVRVLLTPSKARPTPRWWLPFLLYATGMAASIAGAVHLFGLEALRRNLFPQTLVGSGSRRLYAHVTGLNEWPANVAMAAAGLALIFVFIALLRAWERQPWWRALIAIAIAVVCLALVFETVFFRAWTIAQLLLVPFAIRRPREPLALLLLLSLCSSSRIFFRIVPYWYGYVFIIPVVLLAAYVFFEWLPSRNVYGRGTANAWLGVFGAIAVSGLVLAHQNYAHVFPVETPRGVYFDTSEARATAYEALLEHLKRRGARELVVLPEGVALNYLSAIPTPLWQYSFTPIDVVGREERYVNELAARRPQFIVLQPRDMTDFGYRTFGDDYGRNIMEWLRANYAIEARFGPVLLLRPATKPKETPLPGSPSVQAPAPSRK